MHFVALEQEKNAFSYLKAMRQIRKLSTFISPEGSRSAGWIGKGKNTKERKSQVMVLRFKFHNYWIIFSLLKKSVEGFNAPGKTVFRKGKPEIPSWGGSGSDQEKGAFMDRCGARGDFFDLSNTVVEELKACIWRAAIKKYTKRELLVSLSQVLKTYPVLTNPRAHPFRIAIINAIIAETKKSCSIHLRKEELLTWWQKIK